MESLLADLRFALRSLARRRTFTLIAVLTIALGIGPTATMYSVMSGILLNPLGYKDPSQLVAITAHFGNGGDVAGVDAGIPRPQARRHAEALHDHLHRAIR